MSVISFQRIHCRYVIHADIKLGNTVSQIYKIVVNCGNGGDYEYEVDRFRWTNFISKNVPNCTFREVGFLDYQEAGYNICSHSEADKAVITFDTADRFIWFWMIKPEWPPL